jgi:hypothetical protein
VIWKVAAAVVAVLTGAAALAGPASAEPSRRLIVSGFVHQLDDENFGSNPTCDHTFFDNDVVLNEQQLIMHEGWSCGGEVYTEIIAYGDLMPGGAIRYHGKVILHEGTCGCAADNIRASGDFNRVIMPNGNALIDPGYITWSGGDATSVNLQVYNAGS